MYLEAIILKNCSYSIALSKLFKNKIKYIEVDDTTKHKYKTEEIQTFPQLYIKKNNSQQYLIGGYNDTVNILNIIKSNSLEQIKKEIKLKLPLLPNKIILKLVILLKSL